jgi:hypothetical protein
VNENPGKTHSGAGAGVSEKPAVVLLRAAALLRSRAAAVEREMADPANRYWGGPGSERYRAGVSNALGGDSQELACLLTPAAAGDLAVLFSHTAALIAGNRDRFEGTQSSVMVLVLARAILGEEPV